MLSGLCRIFSCDRMIRSRYSGNALKSLLERTVFLMITSHACWKTVGMILGYVEVVGEWMA